MTKEEYEALKALEKPTEEQKKQIEVYENENNINSNNGNTNANSSTNNNNNNSISDSTNINEQDPKKFEEDLTKKESSAEYQTNKAKQQNETSGDIEHNTESKSKIKTVAGFLLLGAVLVFIANKLGFLGTPQASTTAKDDTAGNGTEKRGQETEREEHSDYDPSYDPNYAEGIKS